MNPSRQRSVRGCIVRGREGWDDIAYLSNGNPRQQMAYRALVEHGVMDALKPFHPVLCGTVPLGIDIASSDLDVICEARDLGAFEQTLRRAFSHLPGFAAHLTQVDGFTTCICTFTAGGFAVEVFAQPRPVTDGNAYRHMVVEARLLGLAGGTAADSIRQLKEGGLKTEPAFAAFFGLAGDPYAALLDLYSASDAVLRGVVEQRPQ